MAWNANRRTGSAPGGGGLHAEAERSASSPSRHQTQAPRAAHAPLIGVSSDRLDVGIEHALAHASHLEPVLAAVRDCGCALLIVPQHAGPFRLPRNARPTICIIGGDMFQAAGPGAFHVSSLRRLLRASAGATVVRSAAERGTYALAVAPAVISSVHAALIETRPEQEVPWLEFIRKVAPGLPVLLSTVRGGTA